MDGGAWWAAVHGVARGRTRLSDFTFTFHFHALEKERTTHMSVLAWRIPGTREPGGLPSTGSHRIGHNWSDLAAAAAAAAGIKTKPNYLWETCCSVNTVSVTGTKQNLIIHRVYKKHLFRGFHDGSVVKNLPANTRDMSSILKWGRSRLGGATKFMHHNCWSCALEPESWKNQAHVLQLLKPECPRSCSLPQEKPLQREAHAPKLEKSLGSNKDPAQPLNKQKNFFN